MKRQSEENNDVRECVVEIKELSADERLRMQCEAREDYYRRLSDSFENRENPLR